VKTYHQSNDCYMIICKD